MNMVPIQYHIKPVQQKYHGVINWYPVLNLFVCKEMHCGTFVNGGGDWPVREEIIRLFKILLNYLIFYFILAHKKYSGSFIKLLINCYFYIKKRLNHWCHMDYFNDDFTTLLGLERVSCVAVLGEKVLKFHQNIY